MHTLKRKYVYQSQIKKVYFEILISARYEQYKIKCLQKSFTRSLIEANQQKK